jgi:hypothetical protein
MNKGMIKISIAASTLLCMGTSAIAGGDVAPAEPVVSVKKDIPKRKLKGNMVVEYNVLPGNVDTIRDMFAEGIFYGRLRSNTFYWDWDQENYETGGGQKDNKAWGVGGSLIYKSAVLNGLSFTMGYYGSLNPDIFRMDKDEVGYVKAGKDTFSRYKVKNGGTYDGSYGMHTLGEGYLEYNRGMFDLKGGRQMFESVFTASNDTKMIPNTFDGIAISANIASKTTARAAWFGAQKLRDHEDAHDVITFKDSSGDSWGNNDDAAVHKGLNYNAFVAAGEDVNHDLFLADINTKAVQNLDFTFSALTVPGIVTDLVAEAHYRFNMDSGWAVRPGIRYFYQMDDGGGDVAGYTNLTGKEAIGYDAGVATSLDSSLFCGRIDLEMPDKKGFFRLGYSKVADEADIVAPWRGFPTGGFTRAMAQYNWYANTETFMARAQYKFNSTWTASLRYAIQDFDDAKTTIQPDSDVWHLDTWTNFTKRLQMRMRVGLVDADVGSTGKTDTSYNEYRLEFNYLF